MGGMCWPWRASMAKPRPAPCWHGYSSMPGWIPHNAGLEPGFLIGCIATDLKVSARHDPASRFFVIEADEYDTAFFDKRSKFVHYRPRTAILNNLEFDHADIFPDLHAIETQFHHLVRTIPSSGRILLPAGAGAHPSHFEVRCDGTTAGTVQWDLTGEHNQMNALAALAAAEHVNVPLPAAIAALSAFQGVKRRMELRGTVQDIAVYDDFAHHPTAIATTLAGLRKQVGRGRIIAVLEPRSNTMKLGTMAARLPQALEAADLVFCFGAAQGKHALGWDPAIVLAPLNGRACAYDDLDKMVLAIGRAAQPGDAILVMSNGGFGGVHQKLLQQLQTQAA